MLDFGVNVIKNYVIERSKRMFCINKVIVYKIVGDSEKCIWIIDVLDWSVCGIVFEFVVVVLKDEDGKVYELMEFVGNLNKYLLKINYMEWFLFKWYREKFEFMLLLFEIFVSDCYGSNLLVKEY